MKTYFCSFTCFALLLIGGARHADAQLSVPALSFDADGGFNANAFTSTRGYSFDVTAAGGIVVTGLSVYDQSSDGLSDSHAVGLWNSAGTLLASATVPAGTAASLDGAGFRYVALTLPVALAPGTNYVVGAVFGDNSADYQAFNFDKISTASGMTYDQARYNNNGVASLSFPTTTFSFTGLTGGSLEVLGVPEPTTWTLLLGGAALLAWGLFRRSLARLTSARDALALTVAVGSVSLLASARPAAAQSISSAYTVAGPTDTLTVPFTSSTGITTTDSFSGPVEIQVTGLGHAYYDDLSDAFYMTQSQTEYSQNGMFELAVGTPAHPFPSSDPAAVAIKFDIAFINGVGPVTTGTIPAYSSTDTYDFVINVPNSTATALTFGVDDNNFGDNGGQYNLEVIQLAAVPEPSIWAILLGGAGLLVTGQRLRRPRAA